MMMYISFTFNNFFNLKKIILSIFGCLLVVNLSAQDIHFSQNSFSPLNLNPALAGAMNEDVRLMGSYRSQWQSVPVSYLTYSGAADMKLPQVFSKNKKLQLSAGAIFNHDQAGVSKMTLSSFGIVGSIAYLVNDYNSISIGVQSALAQRNFSMDGLTWQNLYDGDVLNMTLDSRENFANNNFNFVDVGVGLNWRFYKPGTQNHGNFGFSLHHVNQPDQTFDNALDAKLPMRLVVHSMGDIEFHPKWDGIIRAVGNLQGGYSELLVGLGTRYHLSKARGKELAVQFNTFYRVGDAVIPAFEVHYGSWNIGLSYDINTSAFQEATNRNGGLELGIIYTITNVKAVDVFESCPVF